MVGLQIVKQPWRLAGLDGALPSVQQMQSPELGGVLPAARPVPLPSADLRAWLVPSTIKLPGIPRERQLREWAYWLLTRELR